MGGAELGVAASAERLDGVRAVGAMRLQEEPPDVVVAQVADLIALGVGWWHGLPLDKLDKQVYCLFRQPG